MTAPGDEARALDPLRLTDARQEEMALGAIREADLRGPARERAAEREPLDPLLLLPLGLAAAAVLGILWASPSPEHLAVSGTDVPRAGLSPLSEAYAGGAEADPAPPRPPRGTRPRPTAPVTGRAVSPEGLPLVGATVRALTPPPPPPFEASPRAPGTPPARHARPGDPGLAATTAEDGTFEIPDAPLDEPLLLSIEFTGCARIPLLPVPPRDPGARRGVLLRAVPGRDLPVTVEDADGRPVRGVGVSLVVFPSPPGSPPALGPRAAARTERTDDRGRVLLRGVPGEALVQLEAAGHRVESSLPHAFPPPGRRPPPEREPRWRAFRVSGEDFARFVLHPPPAPR